MTASPCVLVVDDNDDHRLLAKVLLGRLNPDRKFLLTEASSGPEALSRLDELVKQGRNVLVITDFVMPEMTGLELMRHVRARHAHEEVRVAVFTSLAKAVFPEAPEFSGEDEMFAKPAGLDTFQRELARIVARWAETVSAAKENQ
ncbi:MAG: response regulator [Euryarchaeota archaeon]|nr:response regulator [Euryarchaeota archaeon]